MNPLDEYSNPKICHICRSIFYLAGRGGTGYPESYENLQGMYKNVNKCDIDISQDEIFIMENSNEVLLDSCSTAVLQQM